MFSRFTATACLGLACAAAQAHEGHGLPGAQHLHGTDLLLVLAAAAVAAAAWWLLRRK
jgi:hypothetical protein